MGLFGNKNKGAAPESKLKISLNREGEEFTFVLDGRLDTLTSPQFNDKVNEVINEAKKLVIDLGKVEYVSSAGLRVLLGAAQGMEERGEMVLIHVTEPVLEVFDVTGFAGLFNIQ